MAKKKAPAKRYLCPECGAKITYVDEHYACTRLEWGKFHIEDEDFEMTSARDKYGESDYACPKCHKNVDPFELEEVK